jgi:1-acyl-sn-glycerol-3-phosphate acyltransferase
LAAFPNLIQGNGMSTFERDNDPLGSPDALARHIKKALATPEPDNWEMTLFYQAVKRLFRPQLVGADNIPDKPCLFVGNHSLFALDGFIFGPVVYKQLGRFVRGLGDKFLFANERVGDAILARGGLMGHPGVCAAMMEHGHDLLVFPGGAHEAVKPTSELYSLQWKERMGFVKLAAQHGYTIMPFGMVGPDEFYGHLMEGQDLPDSRLGALLSRLGLLTEDTRQDILPPIPLGALGTPLPKPQACYIGFGQPIDLSAHKGKRIAKKTLSSIRDEVAEEIEEQLSDMLLLRAQNRSKTGLLRRLLTF